MKKFKKITICLCLLIAMASVFALSAFAETESAEPEAPSKAEESADADKTELDTQAGTESEESLFSVCFDELSKNADKILSALAFIGSLLLAFAYKTGLFPFVERTLGALGNAVGNLRDEVKNGELQKSEFISAIDKKLASVEVLITSFGEKIKILEGELGSMEKERSERESMKLIMRTEVDMLFEIISASSLPQYQKDRASECFMKMKESLKAGDAYEKEN